MILAWKFLEFGILFVTKFRVENIEEFRPRTLHFLDYRFTSPNDRWHWFLVTYLTICESVDGVLMNVLHFRFGYSRVRFGAVESEQVPEKAPEDADGTGRVKDGAPAQMSNQKATQRISQTDADTEP